ncbi:hypothetical protein ETAR_19200 [Edwardsiella tarda]
MAKGLPKRAGRGCKALTWRVYPSGGVPLMPWRNGYCQGWREAGSIRVGDPSGVAIGRDGRL